MTIATATAVPVRTYQIDKAHSEVGFQVRHLLSKVRGRFADFAGTISLDEADPERSAARFSIQAASIDTNNADRDTHLRSDDFFAVEQFPTLTFDSTAVQHRGGQRYDVAGDLTIHGVTRQVTLPVEFFGKATDPWGNEKLGFDVEVTVNRKDFGLSWNAALETGGFLLGDDVKISISAQAA